MSNPKAIPPKAAQFTKGKSGNPKGKPKGARSRSTIARQWLEVEQDVKNPLTGQSERLQQQDLMTLALIKKARAGDVNAFRELMDSAYGKLNQTLTHEGNAAAPVVFQLDPKFGTDKN
jgi:hypothetical protein